VGTDFLCLESGDIFLLDLSETDDATLEDNAILYYQMNTIPKSRGVLCHTILLIVQKALGTLINLCNGAARLHHYAYLCPVSSATVTPKKMVMMNTYKIIKYHSPTDA